MKPMLAQDSKKLLVFDEKVKYRGLFSYYLPRTVAWFLFLALTTYWIFDLIL